MSDQTNSKPAKPEYFLRVTEDRSHGYFHVTVAVCVQKYEQGAGPVPYGVDDGYEYGPKFSDLRITCQGDERSQGKDAEPVYGWDVVFEDCRVDLRTGRRMLKTLELIDRGLGKLEETRGRARSFPEYVGRIGEVLKVKGMCHSRQPSKYNDQRWEWTNLGDGVREIANRIWRWQREAAERAEAAAS